ncbi:hypothetical protein K438DRAFT_2018973 [Mycena galopus ATCC 62051]|nr:hypothetical protein K438DRAFT_2018973 [Mycena galopus ATCC 62051]
MSAKKRAIGDTEDEFQAALATYTKAGNKTIAMRRLWNAAYEIGRGAAEVIWVADIAKERESERVEQARQTAFEEGRQVGEKDALTMDTFEVSFSAGKMDGIATGIELGRQEETQRWKDNGHFEDGMCYAVGIVDSSPPPESLPLDNGAAVLSMAPGLNWADDAESLPIHSLFITPLQPRDFSSLRSGSTNPFNTLQRRQARYYGAQTRTRRPRHLRFHSTAATTTRHPLLRCSARPRLDLVPRSKPSVDGHFTVLGLLAWVWMLAHWASG